MAERQGFELPQRQEIKDLRGHGEPLRDAAEHAERLMDWKWTGRICGSVCAPTARFMISLLSRVLPPPPAFPNVIDSVQAGRGGQNLRKTSRAGQE